MIKVIRLKTIKKALILMIVILIITALIGWRFLVYASSGSKYKILVDVEDSKLYLFENGKLKKEYKCSGGKWSTPSPIGTWEITFKAKWGEGFGRKFFRTKCTMGRVWNTWN